MSATSKNKMMMAQTSAEKFFAEFKKLIESEKNRGYTFNTYEFILESTNFYGLLEENDFNMLFLVLSSYKKGEIDKHTAFVAFYCLCLALYRRGDKKALYEMLDKYVKDDEDKFSFKEYPAIWDLVGRLCVILGDYKAVLTASLLGKKAMPTSVTPGVSFVDAICSFLKAYFMDDEDVTPVDLPVEISKRFIEGVELDEESILLAMRFNIDAINTNPKYAKYYYCLAQLLFYYSYYLQKESSTVINSDKMCNLFLEAIGGFSELNLKREDLLSTNVAKLRLCLDRLMQLVYKYAQNEKLKTEYHRFEDLVNSYYSRDMSSALALKGKILSTTNYDDSRGIIQSSQGEHYMIVSYSHENYKSVFCDILELQQRGVNVVFDNSLSKQHRQSSDEWFTIFSRLYDKADGVLCFLSYEYIQSPSIQRELKLLNSKKIPIFTVDLTGQKQISKIIASGISDGLTFSSDQLNLLTSVFNDNELVYRKDNVPDAVNHIDSLYNGIGKTCGFVVTNILAQTIIDRNKKDGVPYHPNEDSYFCDEQNKIFIVADGITRNEGYSEDESVAKILSQTFCDIFGKCIREELKNNTDVSLAVSYAFERANDELAISLQNNKRYLELEQKAKEDAKAKSLYFEPCGCVMAVGVIKEHILYYGRVGDCSITLFRNNQKIALTYPQTSYAFHIKNKESAREELNLYYVNKVREDGGGYGVVNCDKEVKNLFSVTPIELNDGDELFVMSDGVSGFVDRMPDCFFAKKSIQTILNEQEEIYRESGKPLDDRTVISVKIS